MAAINTTKKNTRGKKGAAEEALATALENAPVSMKPLSALVLSPHNVRTVPYGKESVTELASTILSLGVLQNLVVHEMPDSLFGVAAGGRRLAALTWLLEQGSIPADYAVPVKIIPAELAAAASMAENEKRLAMHPAEQIAGFRKLAEAGNTPAQTAAQLGYPTRHVTRMLKLAYLAPALLDALAKDEIDVEQCQSLTLTEDHERQMQVWTAAKQAFSCRTPSAEYLKRQIINNDIAISDPAFRLVGMEAYLAAGGMLKQDLFSAEDEGFADRLLTEKLLSDKLESDAQHIKDIEGWAWSESRLSPVSHRGEDGKKYQLCWPDPEYTDAELAQISELEDMIDASATYDDEYVFQQRIEDIEQQAVQRLLTPEFKASHGVFVAFENGEMMVQRGVLLRSESEQKAAEDAQAALVRATTREPEAVDGISLPLLTSMSSERTLAVQAALMQQPEKAVALLAWKLCDSIFHGTSYYNPLRVSLTCSHYSLCNHAPTGEQGQAYLALKAEHKRLEKLLPDGWQKDFTTFFTLPGDVIAALLAFCSACAIDGVQTREHGRTSKSTLNRLEPALGFHMRDWWQPTSANFFGQLSRAQITAALTDAGLTGAADDVTKMKKADAAKRAEQDMAANRWVPEWMRSPDASTESVQSTDTAQQAA